MPKNTKSIRTRLLPVALVSGPVSRVGTVGLDDGIERYRGAEVPPIDSLERQSVAEGYEFVARTITEWQADVNRFDRPGELLLLAHAGDSVIGMCGLNQDPYLDDERVARLRHLYVAPAHRGQGAARSLVERCLEEAAPRFERVRLRTSNPAADALYRAMGFAALEEPTATHEWMSPSR